MRLKDVLAARKTAVTLGVVALLTWFGVAAGGAGPPLYRVQLQLVPDARQRPHLLLMTVGGPIYCGQLQSLARHVQASLLCTDYGPNRYEAPGQRAGRTEDWGDPAYDAAVAKLPAQLERSGVKVSALVVIGLSYSGFANAALVASQPRLRPDALIVVDSYLDLTARYNALPSYHETRKEIESVLGGTPEQRPEAYANRSPSHHLERLAMDIRRGMRFIDIWSISPEEKREFNAATCSQAANAQWLAALATELGRPLTGYVTTLRHAHAIWSYGRGLLTLAGLWNAPLPPTERAVNFSPGRPPPLGSYCH